uniref:hypothetical protein n=1 Tax=Serratia proteamaculans TaxID=28151 RepID=UPI001F4BCE68|nr:hypothetical protein [Serratia proteamaculans]ULG17717.1 hypothetical protein F28p_00047 [Serratia proteamaculans]
MKKIMFFLLITLPWFILWLCIYIPIGYQKSCQSEFSISWVNSGGDIKYSNGVFFLSNSLFGSGVGIYSGGIYHVTSDNTVSERIPVHVSFHYDYKLTNGFYKINTTSMTTELGNEADEGEIYRYISPILKTGGSVATQINVLDGGKISTGPTEFPRFICTVKKT